MDIVRLTKSAGLEENKEDKEGDEEELLESHKEFLTNEHLPKEHKNVQ